MGNKVLTFFRTSQVNLSVKVDIFTPNACWYEEKAINRLKAVLAEQGKTNKWLAENLDINKTTVSRWCTNETQPSMDTFIDIAILLNIDVKEIINSTNR